ncbi:MAG: exopolyphosphatase [Acidimicrobiales bacterium]|nr:MAG: exopolyphosphatase [Acidimicrobiales bacterium]
MQRIAAIDCGTNSLRLLIADVSDHGLADVLRRMEIVRLGAGVDRTKQLDEAALRRTRAVLVDYAQLLKLHRVEVVRMVATSAVRDAANAEELRSIVRDVLGIEVTVLNGETEAQLSYLGAAGGLDPAGGPFLVLDIGGGSTEVVYGETPNKPSAAMSMDIGAVRLTERYFRDDPPTLEQVTLAEREIRAAMAKTGAAFLRCARTVVGVAGSVTTVVAITEGLTRYESDRIHHARVTPQQVSEIADWLLTAPHAARAAVKVIHPGRVDVIAAGALILREVLQAMDASELLCSEHDILDGVALAAVGEDFLELHADQ